MPLILGIDPGSRRTGYAFIRQQGRELSVVCSGTIRLRDKAALHERLAELSLQLEALVQANAPDTVAVEDIFSHKNARSALALGQARGAALAVVGRCNVPVAAYPPASVKQAVAGHGRADKGQIQRMVQVLLSLQTVPPEDEADAMAIAICHALRARSAIPLVAPRRARVLVGAQRSVPRKVR